VGRHRQDDRRWMSLTLPLDIASVKGFMDPDEGAALYEAGLAAAAMGPMMEIGSYCGKSAVYLGLAAKARGQLLFTLDHHRGSEELQPGWAHHDPDTWDARARAIDTLPFLRDTLRRAALEAHVVAIVGSSAAVARAWRTPLSLVFIDGGHSLEPATADYRGWAPHVMPGGVLAIHDVFPNPADGGQAPFAIYGLALASGMFEEALSVKSLRVLRRLG
jgi:MMP 1-O-methyltransferase